ncbi:MAG: thymidine phosphorylase [Myxococcales bacterium]|nr:thymidine phosphorylase [Myxococcales bacterium]
MPELIAKKRDGGHLNDSEIQWIIRGYTDGLIPEYQMSALAMAIVWRGMSDEETASLTFAMRDSGTTMNLSAVSRPCIDKHSTGGVGDKVSICLAPMVAACGVAVPMISGRGLGHTGGTLDKLESIPGFGVDMNPSRFVRQLQSLGCALIGQTKDMAPADKRFYALRDVTATVESIPLITASILSKKLASGISGLVLDVKTGQGAFMKTPEEARLLARSLVRIGRLAKKRVSAFLTNMDAPLGRAVGNALETKEAFEVLNGGGPEDLLECTLVLGAEMLRLSGIVKGQAAGQRLLEQTIKDGTALRLMKRIIRAQHGDARVIEEPDRLPRAPYTCTIKAKATGFVHSIDAYGIGRVSVALGAGREQVDEAIDPGVGMILHMKPGDKVVVGQPLVTVHTRTPTLPATLRQRIIEAIHVGSRFVSPAPLILESMRG